MTDSGFEMPPDHIVFQMLSTLDLSAPVIITSRSILPFHEPTPLHPPPPQRVFMQRVFMQQRPINEYETPGHTSAGATVGCGAGARARRSG